MEGPLNCRAYEMRPLRKARKVPNCHFRSRQFEVTYLLTGAVININVVSQILDIIIRGNADVNNQTSPGYLSG